MVCAYTSWLLLVFSVEVVFGVEEVSVWWRMECDISEALVITELGNLVLFLFFSTFVICALLVWDETTGEDTSLYKYHTHMGKGSLCN